MRVSTGMFYETGARSMIERQSEMLRTQDQLSTGRRILTPSDDPIAAAQALRISQSREMAAQHAENAARAGDALAQTETAVANVGDSLMAIRDTLMQAGNPILSDADRRSLALELKARFGELLGNANARDGQGRYLFAGYSEDTQPFVDNGANVSYVGDSGSRALAIGPSRELPVSVNGAALFEAVPVGNGDFTTSVPATNVGDVSVGVGTVSTPPMDGHDYSVTFSVVGGATTFTVIDNTLGTVVSSGNPFTNPQHITMGGATVKVSGTPANGDAINVAPPQRQNVFAAVREAITLLEGPRTTNQQKGAYNTGLERALANIDQASERALAVRSSLGAGMREAQAAGDAQLSLGVAQEAQLSSLRDLDYAQAISDFQRQQQALQAAQKAFQSASQLSLFSLL